ncbi:TPA: PhoPQ-regulated protein [Salmonella enterica]|nr:PhoPQ-regulated protein [Salmonella enterica]
MNDIYLVVIFFILVSVKNCALAYDHEIIHKKHTKTNFSSVITHYQKKISTTPAEYIMTDKINLPQVEIRRYELLSQNWSPDDMVEPRQWRHNVNIYIPKLAKKQRALVVINNGVNYERNMNIRSIPTDFSEKTLENIARNTNTIVISVSDIPNQYLTFHNDKKELKEDESVARSWALFMQMPERRKLLPLQIPMVTSVSQTFRLAEKELTQWNIKKFIVTGISKRGWTTWLTAITNPDVEAIIPFAIDILNTDTVLEHTYHSYGDNWPITFYPYYQQAVDIKIKSSQFHSLLQIIDPLRYAHSSHQPRLAIQKYIVNASGDDFFVPDNTRFYYDKLPGGKSLRVVPNMDHYTIPQIAEDTLVHFLRRYQNQEPIPYITSLVSKHYLILHFSEKPVKIIRWTAINPNARDFRYACGIRYTPHSVGVPSDGRMSIVLNIPEVGWEATYIEATFNDGYVATTQVYITPDGKYVQKVPPAVNAACRTLPGRGLGQDDKSLQ